MVEEPQNEKRKEAAQLRRDDSAFSRCCSSFFAIMFFFMSMGLFFALGEVGLESLYFCLVSVLAVALGVFGSVFNTYSSLYLARDNESLLAMPIPPIYIIASRLVSVYAMGLLYEALVIVPAVAVWLIFGSPSALSVVFSILLIPLLGFLILALTCVLGFVVAAISSHLKNKSIITVIISLVLLGGYYYLCTHADEQHHGGCYSKQRVGRSRNAQLCHASVSVRARGCR